MKIRCFYLVKDHIDVQEFQGISSTEIYETNDGSVEYALYAFTPEKNSELYFKESRNMNLFFEREIEMGREDYEEFCEINKGHVLEFHSFNTKKIVNGIYIPFTIYLLCTEVESDCILFYKEENVMDIISEIITDDFLKFLESHSFLPKIKKALNETFLFEELVQKIYPFEDINYDVITVDDLALYVKLFSNTMSNLKRR